MSDRGKVYVGSLGNNATEREIYDAFSYYGPIRNVWVARRPPGFAFVIYEDPRDAEDAVRSMDGRFVCGRRISAELSHGRSRWPDGRPPDHVLRQEAPRWIPDGEGGSSRRKDRSSRSKTRSRSRSPKGRRRRSKSGSPVRRRKSGSNSPRRRHRSRSRS